MSLSIPPHQIARPSRRRRFIATSSAVVAVMVGLVTLITIDRLRASRALVTPTTDSGLRARADRDKLQQILVNLVNNACKFTQPGGKVTVGCDRADGWVRLEEGRGATFTVLLKAV